VGLLGPRAADDPSRCADERAVEVVDAAEAPILIGQRVLVKFLEPEGTAISGEASTTTAPS
jgi:HlyD family secretion protein